ncbi:MAG TPA: hypothetical protein VMJ12_02110, partial [Candidatus Acidoferrales bacterium]|nr:hypothetical protein [Candidatus Acidoferrales bacterium]
MLPKSRLNQDLPNSSAPSISTFSSAAATSVGQNMTQLRPMTKAPDIEQDDDIDLRELFIRLGRGLGQMIGLGLLGLVVFVLGNIFITWRQPVVTSCRVVFTFSGLERGEYPDHSKFSADDLRAPNIIAEVLKEQGLDTNDDFQSRIRAAINIEGIIPDNPPKTRDTLRPGDSSAYIPDEYIVTLTLPRHFPLSNQQRESLLNGIINVYRENFWRTYAELPQSFGNAFTTLHNADLSDYESILNEDMQNIVGYLNQKVEDTTTPDRNTSRTDTQSRTFRSPTTNLSFGDLLTQIRLFQQIKLNGTLGLIYLNGLSHDRAAAMAKMDYRLQILDDQTNRAEEEEKMVHDLLAEAQKRAQSYVLGI